MAQVIAKVANGPADEGYGERGWVEGIFFEHLPQYIKRVADHLFLPIAVKKGDLFTAAFQYEKRVAPHEGVTSQRFGVHPAIQEEAEGPILQKLEGFWGFQGGVDLLDQRIALQVAVDRHARSSTQCSA